MLKIEVFNPQANAFHKAQTGAVQQLGHQVVGFAQRSDDLGDFRPGHDGRQAWGWGSGPHGIDGVIQVLAQDLLV